jgi:flagellar biosynthesis/type III secretory pathway protein FliH
MKLRSVAEVLSSFGSLEPASGEGEKSPLEPSEDAETEDTTSARDLEIAAGRDDGLAEGLAEGLSRAVAAHAEALEAEQVASARRLAAERDRWAREEGEFLAEKLARGLAEIEARVGAHVANILGGLLADGLRDRAIRELVAHTNALVSGADGKVIAIFGPEDLVTALRERLGVGSTAIEFYPGTSSDVRIVCEDTLVESRLEGWLARLASVVE